MFMSNARNPGSSPKNPFQPMASTINNPLGAAETRLDTGIIPVLQSAIAVEWDSATSSDSSDS